MAIHAFQTRTLLKAGFIALAVLFTSLSQAGAGKINTTLFGNLAVEGYDVVAYFTENQAVEGKKAHTTEWMGANWRFSSAENLALFTANPEAYAPQYGGYCAYAAAKNSLASIEPEQFTVHNGKLYLNYNKRINKKWLQDKDGYISKADSNWPTLGQR